MRTENEINWEAKGIRIPPGRRHGNIKTHCPTPACQARRNRRDKSLSCNLDTGAFNCHYCGWKGTAAVSESGYSSTMPMQTESFTQRAADRPPKSYRLPTHTPSPGISARLEAWFRDRGIGMKTVEAAGVTEGEEWMPQRGAKCNTVQFNYYLDGQLVNTKFRTGAKEFKLVSGARLVPWNINAIRDTPECIITEGEMDALSFWECGRTDVVSVPNGAGGNLDYLDDFIESHFEGKEVIHIAVDTDAKGLELRDELLRRFGRDVCRVVTYGEGCKDANDHLVRYGREGLLARLAAGEELAIEGLSRAGGCMETILGIYRNGMPPGVKVGIPGFDDLVSFETKHLCVITGIPGSGKSEFIDEMAVRLNVRYGWKWGFFSPENSPMEYHVIKLISKMTGKSFGERHLPLGELMRAMGHIDENFFFITPERYDIDTVLELGRHLVRRHGIRALVIDPYNRLRNEAGSLSETLYISQVLDRLSNFALQHDVLVVLMAHPTKMRRGTDGRLEVPTLYDIAGSANFYNKADFGLVVHRERQSQTVELHVQKVRFRHLGAGGKAMLRYNLVNGRYQPDPGDGIEPVWDNHSYLDDIERRLEGERDGPAEGPGNQRGNDGAGEDPSGLPPVQVGEELPPF